MDEQEKKGTPRRHWRWRRALWGLRFLIFMGAIAALFGVVVMGLWNAIVPSVFGGPEVGWLQALGLLVLARVLVGGFGRGRFGGGGHWRSRWQEKMAQMSPEERERMKAMFAARCGR